MKKLSLTVITAISCITLLVACGENRNQYRSPYGPQVGGHCSSYGNSGYGNSGYGNSGYGNSGYGNSGYGNSGYGNSGYGNSGYGNSGYGNSGYGNSGYGHNPRSSYYDPTCTGGVYHRPTSGHGCDMYGQGYRSARHYTQGGSYCTDPYIQQGGASFCIGTRGYCPYRGGIQEAAGTEILLCELNEAPGAACPQGLTCQEIGEGDTGICS